jgi:hypothetical protein
VVTHVTSTARPRSACRRETSIAYERHEPVFETGEDEFAVSPIRHEELPWQMMSLRQRCLAAQRLQDVNERTRPARPVRAGRRGLLRAPVTWHFYLPLLAHSLLTEVFRPAGGQVLGLAAVRTALESFTGPVEANAEDLDAGEVLDRLEAPREQRVTLAIRAALPPRARPRSARSG